MERWLPVPGYEGLYEVSDQGAVMSLKKGRRPRKLQWWRGLYRTIQLFDKTGTGRAKGFYVHNLVLLAFVGPRPDGLVTRHLNGNPSDNRLSNLAYGTYSENQQDSIQHGTQWQSAKTHCPQGHEYNEQNTKMYDGRRYCRPCHREDSRRRRARQKLARSH